MHIKKVIAVILALIFVSGLTGCSEKKPPVYDWAQGVNQEDITSVTLWRQDEAFEPLNDTETLELVTLLNKLTENSFTENKHLRGGTPNFGIEIVTALETYYLNEANGPNGALELSYDEKLWWIDNEELFDFVQRVTDTKSTK